MSAVLNTTQDIIKHNTALAVEFAFMGWEVYPAVYKNGKHIGKVKWGTKATSDYKVVEEWAKEFSGQPIYFCVNLKKSNMMVVDLDDKNGKSGTANFLNILNEKDTEFEYDPTVTTRSPSGGSHAFFKIDSNYKTNANLLCEGGDVPVMVPLPGSYVKGKGLYEQTTGDCYSEPTNVPKWLQKLVYKSDKVESKDLSVDNEDMECNITEAIEYLENEAPIAIKDAGGDATTYNVACEVRDRGISLEKCIELMRNHWYERCIPAYNPDFVDAKAKNAYEYAESMVAVNDAFDDFADDLEAYHTEHTDDPDQISIMNMSDKTSKIEQMKKDAAAQKKEDLDRKKQKDLALVEAAKKHVKERASFIGLDDLLQGFQDVLDRPQNRYVVKNYIPEKTVSMFYGNGGCYKSFATIDMGFKVACGIPWSGYKTYQAPVFYLASEGHITLGERVTAARKALLEEDKYKVPEDVPFFVSKYSIDIFDGEERDPFTKEVTVRSKYNQYIELRDQIETAKIIYGGSPLVIIDTLAKSFTHGNENDTKDMGVYIAKLYQLIEETGCTIILVHHTGVTAKDRARGSSALMNGIDMHALVEKIEDGNDTLCLINMPAKSKNIASPQDVWLQMNTVELGVETDLDGESQKVSSLYCKHIDFFKPSAKKAPKHKPTTVEMEVMEAAVQHHAKDLPGLKKAIVKAQCVDNWEAIDAPEEGASGKWSAAIKEMFDSGYLIQLKGENLRVSSYGLKVVENNVQKE